MEFEIQKFIFGLTEEDKIKERNFFLKNICEIRCEVPLLSPNNILTQESEFNFNLPEIGKNVIGKIDCIFRYHSVNYVVEIKDVSPGEKSFWEASKALCYCEYYKWQIANNAFKPAILIPESSLRLEHQIVAGRLKISIFVFKKVFVHKIGDKIIKRFLFKSRLVGDTPHWKQETL